MAASEVDNPLQNTAALLRYTDAVATSAASMWSQSAISNLHPSPHAPAHVSQFNSDASPVPYYMPRPFPSVLHPHQPLGRTMPEQLPPSRSASVGSSPSVTVRTCQTERVASVCVGTQCEGEATLPVRSVAVEALAEHTDRSSACDDLWQHQARTASTGMQTDTIQTIGRHVQFDTVLLSAAAACQTDSQWDDEGRVQAQRLASAAENVVQRNLESVHVALTSLQSRLNVFHRRTKNLTAHLSAATQTGRTMHLLKQQQLNDELHASDIRNESQAKQITALEQQVASLTASLALAREEVVRRNSEIERSQLSCATLEGLVQQLDYRLHQCSARPATLEQGIQVGGDLPTVAPAEAPATRPISSSQEHPAPMRTCSGSANLRALHAQCRELLSKYAE